MKLIVGLGNIGEEYENTRHNAGFLVLDKIKELIAPRDDFSFDKKFEADVLKIDGVVLVKPRTFMNNSGRSVKKILDYYKIEVADLTVVHDDLDIKMGEYKIQKGVGPKIHNGLNSVEQYLKETDFLRVRVGVDNRVKGVVYGSGADFVLMKLKKEEQQQMAEVSLKAAKELLVTLGLK